MAERIAHPGTIPTFGEVWQPVGGKTHLMGVYWQRITAVRPLVPAGLEIVPVWPGYTLGGTVLSYYGPGSTLVYHEFVVMVARVRFQGAMGFWVSHIYVDSEASVEGGRRIGLQKELAHFAWDDGQPGTCRITRAGRELCTVSYASQLGRLPCWVGASTLTLLDSQVISFYSRYHANFGLCRIDYAIPPESPLAAVDFSNPLLSIAGTGMTGYLAERARVVCVLHARL